MPRPELHRRIREGLAEALWMRGGFPRACVALQAPAWVRGMRSFARTFPKRDAPGLGSRVQPEALGRFWRMLARCHGQAWNAAELGGSMDAAAKTVNCCRDVLEGSVMTRVLPPRFENLGKRLVKSPKVHLRDSGILHHLLSLERRRDLHALPLNNATSVKMETVLE